MKKTKVASYMFLAMTTAVHATEITSHGDLNKEREAVVLKYIESLGNADIDGMTQLFDPTGVVISTSKGKANAIEFFSAFFPYIQTAHTQIHQRFVSKTDSNRYGARFHLDYQLRDGEEGVGEYVDEFIFLDNSTKLSAVYMFENLKFD